MRTSGILAAALGALAAWAAPLEAGLYNTAEPLLGPDESYRQFNYLLLDLRSIGMVETAIAPTFITANHRANIMGEFAPRSRMRLPGTTPTRSAGTGSRICVMPAL